MGSSLEGRPEKRSWAKLWMKKLNFVATLPRLDSINLENKQCQLLDYMLEHKSSSVSELLGKIQTKFLLTETVFTLEVINGLHK